MCDLVEALDELQKLTNIDLSHAYGNVPWSSVRRRLLEQHNDFCGVYVCSRAFVNVQELCIERGLFPFPIYVIENMPTKGINYENLWSTIIALLQTPQSNGMKRAFFVEKKSHAIVGEILPKLTGTMSILNELKLLKPKKQK